MTPAEMREVLLEEARWWANKPAKPDYIPYADRMATRSLWRGRMGHPGHSYGPTRAHPGWRPVERSSS